MLLGTDLIRPAQPALYLIVELFERGDPHSIDPIPPAETLYLGEARAFDAFLEPELQSHPSIGEAGHPSKTRPDHEAQVDLVGHQLVRPAN